MKAIGIPIKTQPTGPRLGSFWLGAALVANFLFFILNIELFISINITPKDRLVFGEVLKLENDLSDCRKIFNLSESQSSNAWEATPVKSEVEIPVMEAMKIVNETAMETEVKIEKEDFADEWEAQKEDTNLFYSIFDDIETINFTNTASGPEVSFTEPEIRVQVHVNCRNILAEVGSDVRMMHRQLIRIINLKNSKINFKLKFWIQSGWPEEEKIFKVKIIGSRYNRVLFL